MLRVDDDAGVRARVETLLAEAPFVRSTTQPRMASCAATSTTAPPRYPSCCAASTPREIPLRAISLSEPTLDDVFLAKTGRSLRDAEAGAAA